MPVGRIYQAPTVTVPRQTPVYGFNGIKSSMPGGNTNHAAVVNGTGSGSSSHAGSPGPDMLVVRGKALSKKKSPSPPELSSSVNSRRSSQHQTATGGRSGHFHPAGSTSPPPPLRTRKSPSPRLGGDLSTMNNGCHDGGSSRPILRNQNKIKSRSQSREPSSHRLLPRLDNGAPVSTAGVSSHPGIRSRLSQSREKSWSPSPSSHHSTDIINNNTSSSNNISNSNSNSNSSSSAELHCSADRVDNHHSADQPSASGCTTDEPTTVANNQAKTNKQQNKNDNNRFQNGYDKERTESGSGGSAGTSSATTTPTAGIGGLKNLGNTCFMNSVIQCLSNTRLLVDYLLSDEYSTDINTTNSSMKGSLVKAFAALIKGLWKPAARIIDPSSLKGAVQRFAPRFSGYNQEDSQEFLRYLLEGLHEDVNRVSVKPQPINTEIDSDLSVEEQGMEAWKRYLRRDDSKLVDIFVGQLKSTLRCSTCDYESVTFEPFWDLSLPIPSRSGEVSLNECLEAFTKEEVLDGDEMPTCGRCKTRRRCVKFYSLYKLPRVLVVHLKRFSPTERFRSKLSSTVTFPLTAFDVSRFSDSPGRCTYSCYAVSNHSGTLYSGHYTAYAKNPKTCEWHYFNDSRVSKSSSSNVISNEAYLLFFELLS